MYMTAIEEVKAQTEIRSEIEIEIGLIDFFMSFDDFRTWT